jgi:hypothetical protein
MVNGSSRVAPLEEPRPRKGSFLDLYGKCTRGAKTSPSFHRQAGASKVFWHESEGCSRCDGSEYRPRMRCAGCGELVGKPSQGGKALMELRTRQGRNQPFYCLDCHQELGRGLTGLEGMGLS